MPFPTITTAPEAPTRSMSNDEFIAAADAFVAWMATLDDQINAWSTYAAAFGASLGVNDAADSIEALAAVTPAADKLAYFTGTNTAALATLTSVARTLLAQSTQGGMRETGLGMSDNGSSLVSAVDYAAMRTLLSIYSSAQTDSAITAAIAAAATVPTGAVQAFAMSTAPTGWLECDGAAVSRTTYSALFTAIGTTHGAGDGSTTFNLPDLRGEFIRGWDHGRAVDSGRAFGSAQSDQLEAHTHTVSAGVGGTGLESGAGGSASTFTTSSTGGTETRPRNIALLYGIKT